MLSRDGVAADRDEKLLLALVSSNLAECCFRGGDSVRSRRLFEESALAIEPYIKESPTYLAQYSFCQSCLFDIELILLGGVVAKLGNSFLSELLTTYTMLPGYGTSEIKLSKLFDSAVVFGGIDTATQYAIDRIIEQQ